MCYGVWPSHLILTTVMPMKLFKIDKQGNKTMQEKLFFLHTSWVPYTVLLYWKERYSQTIFYSLMLMNNCLVFFFLSVIWKYLRTSVSFLLYLEVFQSSWPWSIFLCMGFNGKSLGVADVCICFHLDVTEVIPTQLTLPSSLSRGSWR